jgi:hypothetical protein
MKQEVLFQVFDSSRQAAALATSAAQILGLLFEPATA